MRISVKGRYSLAAMIYIAQNSQNGEHITVIKIAERLGISKIYLEQVFSLLKRAGLVLSVKGAQGGYRLSRLPERISALEILFAVEAALFEKTEPTVLENTPDIESAMHQSVFEPLDKSLKEALARVTLADLVSSAEKHKPEDGFMLYI